VIRIAEPGLAGSSKGVGPLTWRFNAAIQMGRKQRSGDGDRGFAAPMPGWNGGSRGGDVLRVNQPGYLFLFCKLTIMRSLKGTVSPTSIFYSYDRLGNMMRALRPALQVLLFSCGAALGQTNGTLIGASTAAITPPAATSVGPAGVPFGSTELPTAGESPVLAPLGTALPSLAVGQLPFVIAGSGSTRGAGIPLGAAELGNNGLSPVPSATMSQGGSASNCPNVAGGSSSAALPSRLFDGGASGNPSALSTSGCAGVSSSVPGSSGLSQIYKPLAGRSGIPLGASELPNNGISGIVPISPTSPGS